MSTNEELRLVIKVTGPEVDREEVVGRQGLRVGRSADNNLMLNHRQISRNHMRITWADNDTYLVEDLDSSNGIWLNDVRLGTRVATELKLGDVIRVGPFQLAVVRFEVFKVEPVVRQQHKLPAPNGNGNGQNGHSVEIHPEKIYEQSNWLQYLPEIYANHAFMGRYLMIFESVFNPIMWAVDNFDLFLSPEVAPAEWLQWMASWFDMLLLPELPIERQRQIMQQIGWLFLRRGTPMGLKRLLELYFDVTPEISEPEICHFVVKLPLGEKNSKVNVEIANRLIQSQKPAFASFKLEVS